uniref:Uncharacterized protein n=1 Tax=Panagrolaimus davidi TaxID=227884 RepID=A0A914QWD5_9BILA
MSEPEVEAAEVVAEPLAAEEVEDEKVGFDIEELPLQHILLFLPWIQSELPKEQMNKLYNDIFEMTVEQADEVIDSVAIKDGDEHVKDIFKAYHKLFSSDLKIAHRISKWFIEKSGNPMQGFNV